MAVVVLAALDCTVVRFPLSHWPLRAVMILVGGLPMANLLVIGFLPLVRGRSRPGGARPGLVGFEAVGAAGLLLYTGAAFHDPEALRGGVFLALQSFRTLGDPGFLVAVSGALLVPQLCLALLGGWLCEKYRVGSRPPTVDEQGVARLSSDT